MHHRKHRKRSKQHLAVIGIGIAIMAIGLIVNNVYRPDFGDPPMPLAASLLLGAGILIVGLGVVLWVEKRRRRRLGFYQGPLYSVQDAGEWNPGQASSSYQGVAYPNPDPGKCWDERSLWQRAIEKLGLSDSSKRAAAKYIERAAGSPKQEAARKRPHKKHDVSS